jgi:hypothetical protein
MPAAFVHAQHGQPARELSSIDTPADRPSVAAKAACCAALLLLPPLPPPPPPPPTGSAADTLTSSCRLLICCTASTCTLPRLMLSALAVSPRTSTPTMPSLLPLMPVSDLLTDSRLVPSSSSPNDSRMATSDAGSCASTRPLLPQPPSATSTSHCTAPSDRVVVPSLRARAHATRARAQCAHGVRVWSTCAACARTRHWGRCTPHTTEVCHAPADVAEQRASVGCKRARQAGPAGGRAPVVGEGAWRAVEAPRAERRRSILAGRAHLRVCACVCAWCQGPAGGRGAVRVVSSCVRRRDKRRGAASTCTT